MSRRISTKAAESGQTTGGPADDAIAPPVSSATAAEEHHTVVEPEIIEPEILPKQASGKTAAHKAAKPMDVTDAEDEDSEDIGDDLPEDDVAALDPDADILPGNCLPIANIPVGEEIHCIELYPGKGAQLVRAAGVAAQLMAKENGMAQVRLPSGEVRYIRENCKATIGQVGNTDWANIQLGKAGRKRHMGWRPTVRGSVMNPNDHPHGGGEGKSPVGRPGPVTPWGKPALGYKTRKTKNRTDKFIVKRRNAK